MMIPTTALFAFASIRAREADSCAEFNPSLHNLLHWQLHGKAAAFAQFAFNCDAAFVRFDDRLCDG
jgi:hypothetical protein